MKKTIFILGIVLLMAATILSSCQSSAKKVEDAKDKVSEANQELNQAIKDSIQQFKKESEEKINAHAKSIAEFKVRLANEKIENRNNYEKKLEELDQKNTDMKKKLDDYNEEGREKWETFKLEFSRNMDELSRSLKNFTFKNAK